jgi:hypothetical protein
MFRKAICLLSFLPAVVLNASGNGSISGVVLTEEGVPAVNFEVCTRVHSQQSGAELTQTFCSAITDSKGRFTLTDLKPGTYEVVAGNDSEGYSLDHQLSGPIVTVNENSQETVTVWLRNKEAVIIAHISDKLTGKPLDDAHLSYSGVDCEAGGDLIRGIQGQYTLPIPADCAVILVARRKEYRGWVYSDPGNPSRPVLVLSAGHQKLLDVQLEPVSKPQSLR